MHFIDAALAYLNNPAVLSFCGLVLAELKLRYAASDKPLSIAHSVADAARGIANFLDQVLGQNAPKQ